MTNKTKSAVADNFGDKTKLADADKFGDEQNKVSCCWQVLWQTKQSQLMNISLVTNKTKSAVADKFVDKQSKVG